jgi:hypothetical protein
VFRAFAKGTGSRLIVRSRSAHHETENTNGNLKVEWANGVIVDTLRAYAKLLPTNARTTGTGSRPSPSSPSTLRIQTASLPSPSTAARTLVPRFRRRVMIGPPAGGESPAHYAQRMRYAIAPHGAMARELLAAAQATWVKARLKMGRFDTV